MNEAEKNSGFSALTFNTGGQIRKNSQVLESILDLDADLIGLQELTESFWRGRETSKSRSYVEATLREHGYQTGWGAASGAIPILRGIAKKHAYLLEEGQIIAAKEDIFEPISEPDTQIIGETHYHLVGIERRIAQHFPLRLRSNGARIDFFNTHLTHRKSEQRMLEVDALMAYMNLRTDGSGTSLLVGDFNFEPGSEEYEALISQGDGLIDVRKEVGDSSPTFSSENTMNQKILRNLDSENIDYMFLRNLQSANLKVLSSDLVLKELYDDKNLSDHYGVLTKFGLGD